MTNQVNISAPWEFSRWHQAVMSTDGVMVCAIPAHRNADQRVAANARLIEAAPSMLHALASIESIARKLASLHGEGTAFGMQLEGIAEKAAAAQPSLIHIDLQPSGADHEQQG